MTWGFGRRREGRTAEAKWSLLGPDSMNSTGRTWVLYSPAAGRDRSDPARGRPLGTSRNVAETLRTGGGDTVSEYFQDYIAVAAFALFGIVLVAVTLGVTYLVRPSNPDRRDRPRTRTW